MDKLAEPTGGSSLWALMASWFTPKVLFCVLNLIIGTIFVSSTFKSHSKHQHRDGGEHNPNQIRIARAPSLLERVKSFDFSIFPPHHQQESHLQDPPQLARAPSLVDRLKSFDFSIFPPHHQQETHLQDPPQLARAPSLVDRLKSFDFSFFPPHHQQETHHHDPHQLAPAPSLLERVKSIKFSPRMSAHPDPLPAETHLSDPPEDRHVIRSKSAEAGRASAEVEREKKMKKSASDKSSAAAAATTAEEVDRLRPATVREWKKTASFGGEDEGVDAKADDFINRFRQQLKLQRIDSLLRYKEMLNRGSSSK